MIQILQLNVTRVAMGNIYTIVDIALENACITYILTAKLIKTFYLSFRTSVNFTYTCPTNLRETSHIYSFKS